MAETIFGSRLESRTLAGWHPARSDGAYDTAREAVEARAKFNVGVYPLDARLPNTTQFIDRYAILRHPGGGASQTEVWGIVSDEYGLIRPKEVAAIWDEQVDRPIATAGTISRRLFLMTRLAAVDVKGDPVEMYLALVNPMDGLHAASILITGVRIVCVNTLIMAQSLATLKYRVVHDEFAKERLGAWLGHAFEEAQAKQEAIAEAYRILADHRVDSSEFEAIIYTAYPDPKRPATTAPPEIMTKRFEKWEYEVERVQNFRTASWEFFEGAATGADHPAFKGTAWGAYNSIVEVEDYRRTQDESDVEGVTESLLFGDRAAAKSRAFEAALEVASG